MSTLSKWTPPVGLIRPPVSGDPELTSGLVSKILKEAPRTSSKKLDRGLIAGGSRQKTSADVAGDRRLPLSAMLKHMQDRRLPIANLLAVIAKMAEAKKVEFQTATREALPQSVLLVSESELLRDQLHLYLIESGRPVHLDYHAEYESFRTSPGLFLPLFAVVDANLGLEAVTTIVSVMTARGTQLNHHFRIFVLVWDGLQHRKMQMDGAEVVRMEADGQVLPLLPALLPPEMPKLQLQGKPQTV